MQLLKSLGLAAAVLSVAVSSLPSPSAMELVFKRAAESSTYGGYRGFSPKSTCKTKNLSKFKLPPASSGYTSTWTPPAKNLKLARIVIGHGTQNYTCTPNDAAAIPKANGAKATLYDFSCLAAQLSQAQMDKYFHQLPRLFFQSGEAGLPGFLKAFGVKGNHIFVPDATTPVFMFDGEEQDRFVGKKVADTPAPADAIKGEYGAVAWLDLGVKDAAAKNVYQKVYRVMTAGGKPPATCAGVDGESFEMKYATEYWFYEQK